MKTAHTKSASKSFKTTALSAAVVMALGFGTTQLYADQPAPSHTTPQTAAEQARQPVTPTAPGEVNQPTDGQQLTDDVNRAVAADNRRDMDRDRLHADVDPVDAEEFVETASAKGIAEIDTARLALEEGSTAVRAYANKIIEDHTVTNNELKAIAARADLEVADDATLMDRAKEFVLSVRDGSDFDEAYVDNQIAAHENSIELYERAAQSDIPEISAFARGKLPALHEHLRMANALKNQVSSL